MQILYNVHNVFLFSNVHHYKSCKNEEQLINKQVQSCTCKYNDNCSSSFSRNDNTSSLTANSDYLQPVESQWVYNVEQECEEISSGYLRPNSRELHCVNQSAKINKIHMYDNRNDRLFRNCLNLSSAQKNLAEQNNSQGHFSLDLADTIYKIPHKSIDVICKEMPRNINSVYQEVDRSAEFSVNSSAIIGEPNFFANPSSQLDVSVSVESRQKTTTIFPQLLSNK